MVECAIIDCKRESIEDGKCILHCKKSNYQSDKSKLNFLKNFFDELLNYIAVYLEQISPGKYPDSEALISVLFKKSNNLSLKDSFNGQDIVLDNIVFPDRNSNDSFDYIKIFDDFKGIHFVRCEFYTSSLNLLNTSVFFQNCIFNKKWLLFPHKLLTNDKNVLYQICKFKEDVITVVEDYLNKDFESSFFSDCIFEKKLYLEMLIIKNKLFINDGEDKNKLTEFHISKCTFSDNLILNNYSIKKFICSDSYLHGKFEFKYNDVDYFEINNTNFSKLVDYYKSSFIKFKIVKSIFDDFTSFEECTFGLRIEEKNPAYKAIFRYATMLSFVNFRKSIFNCGLDLEHINLKESPNFLHSGISIYNTNRETFRIIKNSFDKAGNYIEANNFYKCEMLKYKEELKRNKNYSHLVLLKLYEISSDYGQSYIRPVFLIFISSIIYCGLIYGYERNSLYSIIPQINWIIAVVSSFLNNISKHIIPITKVLKPGMEFISLCFYSIFTSLIWLIILAIKRGTKR